MVFSDTTNKNGLIQECEFLLGMPDANISGDSTLLKQFTQKINNAYSEVVNLIFKADGRFQWDDRNHTDQPVATFNLVSGQEVYSVLNSVPSAAQDWLQIERLEVKNASGDSKLLTPIDKSDVKMAWTEFLETAGEPVYFNMEGKAIHIKPAPNYNSTGGARAYFKRCPLYFSSTDTTKQPGFDTIFHSYLSLRASKDYALRQEMYNRNNSLMVEIERMKIEIMKFYANRDKYEKMKLTPKYSNFS